MFKVGDRVRMKSLGAHDKENGVTVNAIGIVEKIESRPNLLSAYGGILMRFDAGAVTSPVASGNRRWIGIEHVELISAIAPKRKGFQVGDRVIVVRGNDTAYEMDDLHDEKLFGRFGVITAVKDAVYDYAVRFENFEGWGDGQWGINKTNLRRVTVQNVNG